MTNVIRLTPRTVAEDEATMLCTLYGLSRMQGRILYMLATAWQISVADLSESVGTDDATLRNAISRMRDKLSVHRITVQSRYSVGYYLPFDNRKAVRVALNNCIMQTEELVSSCI